MATPLDIITHALQDIGAIGAADGSPEAEDAALCLSHYNRMIGYLAARQLGWYEVNEAFTFSASQQSYSIGPAGSGADFIMTAAGVRPPKIDRAKLVLTAGSPDTERVIPIYTVQIYEGIVQPARSAAEPLAVYYQPTFPTGTLWPVPYPTTTSNQLRLFWKNQLAEVAVAAISTDIDMPSGVEGALTDELMKRIAPAFRKTIGAERLMMAADSWTVLLTLKNADPAYIQTDLAGTDRNTAQTFNPATLRNY